MLCITPVPAYREQDGVIVCVSVMSAGQRVKTDENCK